MGIWRDYDYIDYHNINKVEEQESAEPESKYTALKTLHGPLINNDSNLNDGDKGQG